MHPVTDVQMGSRFALRQKGVSQLHVWTFLLTLMTMCAYLDISHVYALGFVWPPSECTSNYCTCKVVFSDVLVVILIFCAAFQTVSG